MDWISVNLFNFPLLSVIPHRLAYIDPGTGSIIVQAAIAAAAGVAIAVKLYWDRLLKFLGIRKSVKNEISGNNDMSENAEGKGSETHS